MKTAISLPDPLFEEADRVARKRGISRSELYARALDEHLAKTRSDEIREAYDRVYGEEPDDPAERALREAGLRDLRNRTEW
jgi:metal-responsive CopG/Arc/MetJ family transcriptional regulator